MTNIIPIDEAKEVQNLPTNVHTKQDLALLPDKYLSDDPKRPLYMHPFKYALKPLYYSVFFILIIECLERFTYYGINTTETAFLIGSYDQEWNANLTSVQAASYTSASIGIAYTAPFLGGILADGFLGEYWCIIFGVGALYIPGLVLIALTTFPGLLGPTFNLKALTAGLLVLMPIGTGFIKPLVNVFGAKQYHSLLQSSQLESYYVNFYLSINIGSLIGTTLIPILAQIHLQAAYLIPCLSLVVGLLIFIAGSKRYVNRPPENKALLHTTKILGKRLFLCKSLDDSKLSHGGSYDDAFVDGVKRLLLIIPISLLTLPFVIAYSQMSTIFILQGEAMRPMGLLDASLMSSFDPISVLVVGFLVGSILYPTLSKRGRRIPLTYKFAIGTAFGSLAIAAAIVVDHSIRTNYQRDGTEISILWQAFSYILVGCGEIFAFTSCLEATFSIAPPEQKGLASALNQFLTLALSSFICVGLNNAFSDWFPQPPTDGTGGGDSSVTEQYANSELGKFLWVTFGITLLGIVVNVLGPVKRWADSLHQGAIHATATATSSSGSSDSDDNSDIDQSLGEKSSPSDKVDDRIE